MLCRRDGPQRRRNSIAARVRDVCQLQSWGPLSLPIQWVAVPTSLGLKWPECEAD